MGGMIYVLWRSDSLLMFHWFATLGIDQQIRQLREAVAPYSGALPSAVCFSLPQALWLLSGILYSHSIWRDVSTLSWLFWTALLVVTALVAELGQLVGIVPGRFDIWDLLSLVAACLCGYAIVGVESLRERRVLWERP